MPDEVFGLFFDKVRSFHVSYANHHLRTNDCDCQYCRSLRLYVSTKMVMHKTKRKLLRDGYAMEEVPEIEEKLQVLKKLVTTQRKIKNESKS